ncbi:MAG: RNA polymerase sigma factor [Actinobacteria bacterium]|nr:RNA polymerase sigma factor [Actinomycetota bacterium]MCB9388409.1 RNA polymerase sigma factor [Acidimicrobiia bacterium]
MAPVQRQTATPVSATSRPPVTAVTSEDNPTNSAPIQPVPDDISEIVKEHSAAVFRVAVSIVRDKALAEDVTQDTFVKAWKALPTFRGEGSLRGWLLRIAHNTAVSALRRIREDPYEPDWLPEQAAGTTIERVVEGRAAVNDLWAALDQLDETSKTIVVLREVEGMSYDEIAETLNVSLPTVKTRLFRARKALTESLAGWSR